MRVLQNEYKLSSVVTLYHSSIVRLIIPHLGLGFGVVRLRSQEWKLISDIFGNDNIPTNMVSDCVLLHIWTRSMISSKWSWQLNYIPKPLYIFCLKMLLWLKRGHRQSLRFGGGERKNLTLDYSLLHTHLHEKLQFLLCVNFLFCNLGWRF